MSALYEANSSGSAADIYIQMQHPKCSHYIQYHAWPS